MISPFATGGASVFVAPGAAGPPTLAIVGAIRGAHQGQRYRGRRCCWAVPERKGKGRYGDGPRCYTAIGHFISRGSFWQEHFGRRSAALPGSSPLFVRSEATFDVGLHGCSVQVCR